MTVIEDIVNRQFGEGKLTFLHLAAQAGHRLIYIYILIFFYICIYTIQLSEGKQNRTHVFIYAVYSS